MAIVLKSRSEIDTIRKACRIVSEVLGLIGRMVRPGVSTGELDEAAEDYIVSENARPAFKGYRGYPATLCTSIDSEVVHGIPSFKRRLEAGQVLSIDVGAIYDGFYGDSARTFLVGSTGRDNDSDGQSLQGRLLRVTQEALMHGVTQARPGNHLGDISWAIQSHVERNGFSVVRDLVGHGIGRQMHEEPQVPNYGRPGTGPVLKEGMVLAIEPMVNAGGFAVRTLSDGWTVVTVDGSLSAHFEHTVAIGPEDPEILTL